ncbi:hypothetical protein DAPPUDRAFT_47827, partial [Daphnia pulex]
RDDNPQIRAICMVEICIWFKQFPKHFLDDSYFTFISELGLNLFDKISDVRLKCLKALQPLYATK